MDKDRIKILQHLADNEELFSDEEYDELYDNALHWNSHQLPLLVEEINELMLSKQADDLDYFDEPKWTH